MPKNPQGFLNFLRILHILSFTVSTVTGAPRRIPFQPGHHRALRAGAFVIRHRHGPIGGGILGHHRHLAHSRMQHCLGGWPGFGGIRVALPAPLADHHEIRALGPLLCPPCFRVSPLISILDDPAEMVNGRPENSWRGARRRDLIFRRGGFARDTGRRGLETGEEIGG